MNISPLIFEPIFKSKIWGARKLSALNKRLPPEEPIGESWECVDLPTAQSIVARGPQRGKSLHDLMTAWGSDLLGRTPAALGRFPLLIKFLDVHESLSVQVHPDAAACARMQLNVPPKNEAWYIIEAGANAEVYRGLADGITKADLTERLARDPRNILDALRRIQPRSGECYYLPAGTIHAVSGDMLIAEVQTPCDVTYRLYDWNRSRPAGDAGLHIEQGLQCVNTDIDFDMYEQRFHVTSIFTTVTRLVNCPSFCIEKVRFMEGMEQDIPYAELVIWIVLSGRGEIQYSKGLSESFSTGDVVILPAGLEKGRLKTAANCAWLEVSVPVVSDLSGFPRPHADDMRESPQSKVIPLGLDKLRPPGA
jgi:mannose-6-phosphate isomerase